ncbi:MAG: TatD family hydrolase [Candidatus Omnitrophica bacterium]|nr:TatD family hydrolase [Candidatus Omnitrophota bacterium]
MLFDVHCHINSLKAEQIEELVSNCKYNYCFIDSSIDYQTSLKSLELSSKYPFIYSSIGFHPFSSKSYLPSLLSDYQELILKNKKIVAIGEIGLDFKALDFVSFEIQEKIFKDFILLAKKLNLALIIHNRTEDFRILEILDEFFNSYHKIIFHCFSYGKEFMLKILEKGGFISFSPNILRQNKDIISSLVNCPLESLFLETDSPYMKINQKPSLPFDIGKVYEAVAVTKNIEIEILEQSIFENAKKIFNI